MNHTASRSPGSTIFALATPPGRAGVAVIRVSGPQAAEGALALTGQWALQPHRMAVGNIRHPVTRDLIDHALAVYFKNPASYTGEDTVEYHTHGSPAVVQALLRALATLPGHRMAEPGEFTRRAFENGKIDLTEAEGIADLINAETELQRVQAVAQMSGVLAALYDGWRDELARALAHLEADIDFPDEDLPGGVAVQVKPVLEKLLDEIRAHLDDNRRGEMLRDGIHVAVIGAPNAGKSSLVNALAQREVAIVSDIAGTTRDIVEAHLNLGGYPVIVSDTAGLRPEQLGATGHDKIESEGIKRALQRAQDADIKILLFDASSAPDENTMNLRDENSMIVFNKTDLSPHAGESGTLNISVKTGAGLKDLINALIEKIKALTGTRTTPSLTRARHRAALGDCASSLLHALDAKESELIAEDTRLAIRALGRITGRVDVEDLLDVIFRDFCIGK
ncbi:MAG TPA: tRNA uridine-5-carboxymethylaminomethyl(34) synthesis GTPase MnmE [Alphaproteobacteria bacterium]